MQDIFAV